MHKERKRFQRLQIHGNACLRVIRPLIIHFVTEHALRTHTQIFTSQFLFAVPYKCLNNFPEKDVFTWILMEQCFRFLKSVTALCHVNLIRFFVLIWNGTKRHSTLPKWVSSYSIINTTEGWIYCPRSPFIIAKKAFSTWLLDWYWNGYFRRTP